MDKNYEKQQKHQQWQQKQREQHGQQHPQHGNPKKHPVSEKQLGKTSGGANKSRACGMCGRSPCDCKSR